MKNTFKFIMAAILTGSMLFYSCETNDLELIATPNSLTVDQADPNLLLNTIQLGYLFNMGTFNGSASSLTRINVFGSRDYFAGITGLTLNNAWSSLYSTAFGDTRGMIPNASAIEELNAAAGDGSLNFQEGVSKTLIAHQLMLMVDFVGDIPFSQINNPLEFPSPEVDSGADVYAGALGLLDEAEALLTGSQGQDLFYNGDAEQWIRLVNTIRMKAALTTGDIAAFQTIEAGGNFITDNSDDFEFTYGTNDVNPDERHPDYVADYTPSGAGQYRSNWLMDLMLNNDDPRRFYYFYRQQDCTPGASCNPNPMGEAVTQLQCSIQIAPTHVTDAGFGDIFCFVEDGYWGRTHGDNSGIPPDGFNRTANGVYPAGGLYDDSAFGAVGLDLGGGGAGIEPFILASYVDFMRAEVALASGDAEGAAGFIEAGLTKSMDKVLEFDSLDTSRDASMDVTSGEAAAYVDSIVTAFMDAAPGPDQWNILAEQNWTTQYGGGAETYNFYRRTGFPTTIPPNLEPNPGTFVRSFPYPNNEVVANPNISQKADQTVQVFWDTNPPSALTGGFPAAN